MKNNTSELTSEHNSSEKICKFVSLKSYVKMLLNLENFKHKRFFNNNK